VVVIEKMSYEETVMDGKQMATRRDVLQGAVGVVAGGALAFTFEAALAQEASPAAGGSLLAGLGLPELHIRITEDGFDVTPSSIPAGRVLLVVENAASDEASADLIGPPEGMGMDAFMAETQASPVAGSAVGTPGVESGDEGFPSWLYEARLTGGPVVQAGQTGYAVVELAAGDWAVAGEGNQAPAMVTATGEAGATPAAGTEPPADLAVTMQDYAFVGLPETVPPGRQIWKVTNQGPEIHNDDRLFGARGSHIAGDPRHLPGARTERHTGPRRADPGVRLRAGNGAGDQLRGADNLGRTGSRPGQLPRCLLRAG
jgi:hypothetical protein